MPGMLRDDSTELRPPEPVTGGVITTTVGVATGVSPAIAVAVAAGVLGAVLVGVGTCPTS
jgi:mannose/fructose/N-acetylgalactosamine-specific phosphotransferase system component IIC